MSDAERQMLDEFHRRVHEQFKTLPPEDKVQRLKDLGILDRDGRLSSRYGGDGERQGDEQVLAS